jgi:Flp pilus assembly protein TadG
LAAGRVKFLLNAGCSTAAHVFGASGSAANGLGKGPAMKNRIGTQMLLRLAREEVGAELVEFSLTALILIVLLFGVFNWMFGMYAYHFTTYAAQQSSRFAMVRGHTWSKNTTTSCSTSAPPNFKLSYNCTASSADIENYVQSLATPGINPTKVTIDTTSSDVWPGQTPDGATTPCATNANSPGCLVKVKVSYTFNFLPFLKLSALPISATSEKVILQ